MPLQLSQSALTVLSLCQRKFQHIYWDQLSGLMPMEQRSHLEWGSRFHHLMQQRDLGLPLHANPADDLSFYRCMEALVHHVPQIFDPSAWRDRLSEHRRTLRLGDAVFTAVYDLLLLGDDQAQIIDWKTYSRPQQSHWLAQHWQTRLYPFVLAETSAYRPDQISMTYWFVQPYLTEPIPQSITFPYSAAQHQQTRQSLTTLVEHLTASLAAYQEGQPLPQLPAGSPVCQDCPFALRCQRGAYAIDTPALPPLTDIAEVVL